MVALTTQPVGEAQMGGFRELPALLLICCHSLPAEKPEPASSGLRITVRVYDGVHLSPNELNRAEGEAEKVFLYAGIQLVWTTGPLSADVNDDTPNASWDPASLQLRIWPRAMAGKRPRSSETLGFCLSLENGEAVVLADTIRKRAVFGTTSFADLFGLAIAHELGHLLLRSASHSVAGIMRARWTERGLRDDDRGYLRFTPGEAESMRREVKRRMAVKSVSK
jgi:hypothetical protein